MDSAPEEQKQLYKALFDCNRHIPEENRIIVPFICVSAVPCGLLYKENLESIPTVSDTFTALFNCTQTNEIALTLIKFALEVAGCPSEKIEQVQNAGVQETGTIQGIHTLHNDEVRQGLQFHKLLVDIVNDLTADLRRQLINMSSGYLSSNPIHTECLHVHFLRLIQENVIGLKDVSKLHEFIESIRRQDILDRIDEYCRDVGLPILARTSAHQVPQALMIQDQLTNEIYPAPEQESGGPPAVTQVHTTQLHRVEMDKPTEAPLEQLEDEDNNNRPTKGCNACRDHIVKWKRCTIATSIMMALALCCLIVFLIFELYPSASGQVFFEEGDVVMVSNNGFDPFYYTAVNFTRNDSRTHPNDMSNIKLYMQQCSKLVPNQRPILTNITHIPPSNEDRRHPVYQGYLVRGSKAVFTVNISTSAVFPDCSAALYIFNDYQLYYNFLYFGSHAKSTKICLCTSNTSHQHLFTSNTSSYYFVVLSAPTNGVNDIHFQTTGTQMYYTTHNLSPSCNIIRGTNSSCSVPLNTLNQSVQLSIGNLECFLAVLLAESAISTGSDNKLYAYLSYSSSTARNPIHNIAKLLTLLLPVFSLLLTIVIALVYRFVRCSRSASPNYVRIDSCNTTDTET